MASALLGKCVPLFVLVFLLNGCCDAFRIREHASSAEQTRHTCASMFGSCQEKTTPRKWLAAARKPPVELTSNDDDAGTEEEEEEVVVEVEEEEDSEVEDEILGGRRWKNGKVRDLGDSAGEEDEEDDENEGEEDEEDERKIDLEKKVKKQVKTGVEEDEEGSFERKMSLEKSKRQKSVEEDEEEEEDDTGRKMNVQKKSAKQKSVEEGEEEEEDDTGRKMNVQKKYAKQKSVEEGEEEEEDDTGRKMNVQKKSAKQKSVEEDEEGDNKRKMSSEKSKRQKSVEEDEEEEEDDTGRKMNVQKKSKKQKSAEEDEEDTDEDEEDEEQEEAGSEKKMSVQKKSKKQKSVEEDEKDTNEDEEVEEGGFQKKSKKQESVEDEEEDEDDEEEEETPTPPPRKLEKVRHADKDKFRSTETSTIRESAKKSEESTRKLEEFAEKLTELPKKLTELPKKLTELPKKFTESPLKLTESPKKLTESPKKPEELPKKLTESPKKPSESPKKLTESPKKPPESPKTPDSPKKTEFQPKPAKRKPETEAKSKSKQPEVKRTDKDESKVRRKTAEQAPFTLARLNDAILRVPTFVPNFTAIEDFECQQHGKIFLRQLRGFKLWALQMLDSSGKIPSGLLRGNVNQFGDFDECLGITAHVKLDDKTIKVQGKYCLANIDLYPARPDMKLPVNLIQARAFVRGSMHDEGHFVPKFTTVNWALCLPAACSAEDAQTVLEQALRDYNSTIGIRFTVDVDPNMCYVKQKSRSYSKETIGVLYFYAMVVCLVAVATVRDYLVVSEGKGNYSERIIMSFSLRRTIKSLLKKGSSEAEITCIHGIRALATILIYIAHQLIPISRLPFSNRIELTEVANNPISSVLRVSMVYTDSFLLLSGVLTAYNMAHEFKVRGEIRWFCRFIARYIRLTPALLAVVFWYAFVMEHTGSGPQWNSIVLPNAELCKSNAWTNLLYIQNFFPFEEMCATHTHQLALDMQLSLLAPMLVFFLEFKPIVGIILMFFFVLLSATLRYIATMNNYLSLVIFHGISIKHLYRTANLMYALPLHRATPYMFGVTLGVLLRNTGREVRIHKVLVILGWLIAMALGSWSLFSPWHLARRDYVYDAEEATQYAVISPVVWALAICWLIFACYTNQGGPINRFLSNYCLLIFSRISYAVYLTQFTVFFYNVGTTRYSSEFQLHRAIDPLEATTVLAVSVLVTLCFDVPMQEIKTVMMESTDVMTTEIPIKEPVPIAEEEKKPVKKVFEEDEVSSTGWDWQRDIVDGGAKYETLEDEERVDVPILKKPGGRRRSFLGPDSPEEWVRRSREEDEEYRSRRSSQRDYQEKLDSQRDYQEKFDSQRDYQEKLGNQRDYQDEEDALDLSRAQQEEALRRSRRSHSRQFEEEDPRRRRGRSAIREVDDHRSREASNKDHPKRLFSKSEERQTRAHPSVEPRISDEEDWESELRIRRKQFMEKLAIQQPRDSYEEDFSSLRRRSSAEGKIALLKDPSANDNMDSWTISVGSRVAQLGSSQERSEPEDDAYTRRREYRERAPPPREETQSEEDWDESRRRSYTSSSQITSMEEDEEVAEYNFVLTKDSKRISVQDLSRLSAEEPELSESGWNVVEGAPKSMGLFKRESIIKSQASEEDPEYLLPERPKLVQQEREHPFKKAWQMQKSRSEEDYVIKEGKSRKDDVPEMKKESSGEQYEDTGSFADDESESVSLARSKSSDTEENRTSSKSEETETTERSEKTDSRSSGPEEDSVRLNWPSDEQLDVYKRSKSEEVEWRLEK